MTVDLLLLSNGPGEIMTWVRPVVKTLRQVWGTDLDQVRISVILSPCPNAMGKEAAIARSYPEVDRVQSSEYFFSTLLWGKTAENWDWREKGVVLFLGGDQAFAVIIAKRLGYKLVIYGEWEARWYRWVDHFGVRNEAVKAKVPINYQHKCTVIGDLMVDIPDLAVEKSLESPIIGLMPGSKPNKLRQGVPLILAIAHHVYQQASQVQFILPVAPTLQPKDLAIYADPDHNPFVKTFQGIEVNLIETEGNYYLKSASGLTIQLITDYPAYSVLSQCSLALTTVGANTAELGALGVPMIILLPTQELDAMKSWDGLGGILARLPGLGSIIAKTINLIVIRQGKLFAWPNIWAKEMIVPELVGKLDPITVATQVLDYLDHPEKLDKISDRLKEIRGQFGAALALAKITQQVLRE